MPLGPVGTTIKSPAKVDARSQVVHHPIMQKVLVAGVIVVGVVIAVKAAPIAAAALAGAGAWRFFRPQFNPAAGAPYLHIIDPNDPKMGA